MSIDMTLCTKQQKTTIATLCHVLHINKEDKAIMVSGFTGGRCESSKDMSTQEAADMIQHLLKLQGSTHTKKPGDKMINKILAYCHELGWTKKNKTGNTVADVKRFDEWAVSYSYLKKKLGQYKYNELPKLVSQVEALYKHHLKRF